MSLPSKSAQYSVAWFIEMAAYGAVNCYALITGYVGYDSEFKYSSIITMWFKVSWWSCLLTLFIYIYNPTLVGLKEIARAVMPVICEQWWYVTAYFGLFLFMPFLKKAVTELDDRSLKILLASLLIVFSIIPELRQADIFQTATGFSPLWLAICYILGASINRLKIAERKCADVYGLVTYVLCAVIAWVCTVDFIASKTGVVLRLKYTSPIVLLGSIALFVFFVGLRIPNKLSKAVLLLAPYTFDVYLIHEHLLIRNNVIKDRFAHFNTFATIELFFAIILWAVVILSICTLCGMIRKKIFDMAKIAELSEKLLNMMKLYK